MNQPSKNKKQIIITLPVPTEPSMSIQFYFTGDSFDDPFTGRDMFRIQRLLMSEYRKHQRSMVREDQKQKSETIAGLTKES